MLRTIWSIPLLLGLALAHDPETLWAEKAVIRLGTDFAFVYTTLINKSNQAVRVSRAESPMAMIEFRRAGSAVKTLEIPPRGRLVLRPDGYRLAMPVPSGFLKSGDKVPIVLYLEDGDVVALVAEVKT